MKKCNLWKPISAILLLIMVSSFVIGAYASSIQPRYAYVSDITVSLDISGGTVYYGGFGAGLYKDTNTKLYIMLQCKPTSGGGWSTVETQIDTADGRATASCSGDAKAESGYTYRTYALINIYDEDGNVLERATMSSHTMSY